MYVDILCNILCVDQCCRPDLLYPFQKYGSEIKLDPYQPCKAVVEGIVDWGTCSVQDTNF